VTTAGGGVEARFSPSADAERLRALVIDDESSIRHLLSEVLDSLGFHVDEAADGGAGLALCEERIYELVVTDLNMPGLSGWEVVEGVRRRAPAARLIMVTGSAENLDRARARAQALVLLQKPFRIEELRNAIEEALRSKMATGPRGNRVGACRRSTR